MSWFDHQEEVTKGPGAHKAKKLKTLEVKLPGGSGFIPMNKNSIRKVYEDDIGGPLLIIVDEAAELLMRSGLKSEEGKEEDALKAEIEGIIQSITQLGRSSGIHCIIATQRNDTKIINGTIQNNCLSVDTKVNIV